MYFTNSFILSFPWTQWSDIKMKYFAVVQYTDSCVHSQQYIGTILILLGGPPCQWPCYHHWITRGMCQEALDLERNNGGERTESKCKKNEDHNLWYGPGPLAEFRWVSMCRLSDWSGQQQHLLQRLQVLGAKEMQWAQVLDKGPWLQLYMVPGNCRPLRWQTTEGSPSRTWQARGGSFVLLCRKHALSSWWLWTFNHNMCENCLEEVQGAATSSLFPSPLFQDTWPCVQLVCGVQCSMPVRLGHWQSQTSNVYSEWQGNDQQIRNVKPPPDPMSYLRGLALRIWTSFWGREGFAGMDMWNAQMVQSRLWPTGWWTKHGPGRPQMTWKRSWQRGIAESGSSRLSNLMINIPGDLVWDLPYVQQASYLEGGLLMWTDLQIRMLTGPGTDIV